MCSVVRVVYNGSVRMGQVSVGQRWAVAEWADALS